MNRYKYSSKDGCSCSLIHVTSCNNDEYFFKAIVATPRLQPRVPLAGPEVDTREPAGLGRQHLGDLYAESGQTLQGSFSAVSKPNFATKYALESSRRDLHNALLCTALESNPPKPGKTLHRSLISIFSLKIAELFADFFQNVANFARILLNFC